MNIGEPINENCSHVFIDISLFVLNVAWTWMGSSLFTLAIFKDNACIFWDSLWIALILLIKGLHFWGSVFNLHLSFIWFRFLLFFFMWYLMTLLLNFYCILCLILWLLLLLYLKIHLCVLRMHNIIIIHDLLCMLWD